jgi:hypothetical protein
LEINFQEGRGPPIFESKRIENQILFEMEAVQAEKKILNYARKADISQKGRIWMENCLDPFSDEERDVVGYPDNANGRSYVKKIPLGYTYSNTSGATEDLSVFLDPWGATDTLYNANWVVDGATAIQNQYEQFTSQTTTLAGGIQIRKAAGGTPLTGSTKLNYLALQRSAFYGGKVRIVGVGLEVTNTTAVINRGGAVIIYQDVLNESLAPIFAINTTPSSARSWFKQDESYAPPETSAQALAIPGARTWSAAKGAYIVGRLCKQEHPPVVPRMCMLGFTDSVNTATGAWQSTDVLGGVNYKYPAYPNFPINFNPCGAFFSGLPSGTELTFRALYYVEIFPDFGSPDLSLSKPSVPLDICALEAYSEVAKLLPAGVPVDDNDLGDWLETIAETLDEVGVPFAGLAKTAIKVGRKVIDKMNEPNNVPKSIQPKTNINRQLNNIEREIKVVKKSNKNKNISMNQRRKQKNKRMVKKNLMRDL